MANLMTPTFRMADRLTDGNLAHILVELRDGGLSWRTMSRHLYDTYGIEASDIVLADWHRRITSTDGEVSA